MSRCGCVEHGLECITFYVQKYIAHLVACSGRLLVRDGPRLREPAFVKMVYSHQKEPVTRQMFPFDDVIMALPCVAICQDKSIYVKSLK